MMDSVSVHTDKSRLGLWLGGWAITVWSFSAALTRLGGEGLSPWVFMAIVGTISGVVLAAYRGWTRGRWNDAFIMPPKLWAAAILGVTLYLVIYAYALMLAPTDGDACVVYLLNCLWPTLTVIFGVLLVPGGRFTRMIVVAAVLAFLGTMFANGDRLMAAFSSGGSSMSTLAWITYGLGAAAGVLWALYSTILARWSAWAVNYSTTPVGMLGLGVVGLIGSLFHPADWQAVTTKSLIICVVQAVGPQGFGYLLWELALTRANVRTLGLMAAVLPALSVVWLCVLCGHVPSMYLAVGAVLTCVAVILGQMGEKNVEEKLRS